MQPVRVRVYGLVALTRRTYLVVQAVGLGVVVAAVAVGVALPRPMPPEGEPLPPFAAAVAALVEWLPWLAVLFLIAGVVETALVLREFARMEADQRSASEGGQLAPRVEAPTRGGS